MTFEKGDWVLNRSSGERGRYQRGWAHSTPYMDSDIELYTRFLGPNPRRFLNCEDWCIVVGENNAAYYAPECMLERIEPFDVEPNHRLRRSFTDVDNPPVEQQRKSMKYKMVSWADEYGRWSESFQLAAREVEQLQNARITWQP